MTRPLVPQLPKPPVAWRPRPLQPILAVAGLLIVVLAAAGAGTQSGRTSTDGAGVPRSMGTVASASIAVQIVNFAFAPAALAVDVGDTVTWTNQDTAPHTATTSSGPQAINSPTLSKGQSWSFTFSVPGTYLYYCAVHPDMRAEIVVRAVPASAAPTSAAAAPAAHAPPPTSSGSTKPQGTVRPGSTASAPTHAMTHADSAAGAPAASTSSAAPAPAAAAPQGPSDAAGATAPVPASAQAVVAEPGHTGGNALSPGLLLAGLTAAITVFCLLLVASRSSGGREERADGSP